MDVEKVIQDIEQLMPHDGLDEVGSGFYSFHCDGCGIRLGWRTSGTDSEEFCDACMKHDIKEKYNENE